MGGLVMEMTGFQTIGSPDSPFSEAASRWREKVYCAEGAYIRGSQFSLRLSVCLSVCRRPMSL